MFSLYGAAQLFVHIISIKRKPRLDCRCESLSYCCLHWTEGSFPTLGFYGAAQLFAHTYIQLNLNGSNFFGAREICSRYGKFEPLRVDHSARLGDK